MSFSSHSCYTNVGYDAGKKIKGKKRHLLVDTQGLMCGIVHSADIQDRDGGLLLMSVLFGLYPFLLKLYADSGYEAPKFRNGLKRVWQQINAEIVKRSDDGFGLFSSFASFVVQLVG